MTEPLTTKPLPGAFEKRLVPPDMDHQYFQNAALVPFPADSREFNAAAMWWLAETAFLSYCHPQFVRLAMHSVGFPRWRFFDGSVAECFVAANETTAIVFVRGTEVFSVNAFFDVIADLNIRMVEESVGGKVHRGFAEALDEVWSGTEGVEQHLRGLQSSGVEHLWFTGHSLGAAIATLAAARFGDARGVYTFGSPRVGNREFVETLAAPVYRVVNNRDPVAQLPPTVRLPGGLVFDYDHCGTEYRFDSEGVLRRSTEEAEEATVEANPEGAAPEGIQVRLSRWIRESLPGTPTDHSPLYYALRAWNTVVESL